MVDLPRRPSQFYDYLYGEQIEGFVSLSVLDQAQIGNPGAWSDTVEAIPLSGGEVGQRIEAAVEAVTADSQNRLNVYFTPAPRRTAKRGYAGNTLALTALWAEFDSVTSSPGKDPASSFAEVSEVHALFFQGGYPEPSMIVQSGNGWHCYWPLDEPLEWPGPNDITGQLLARWGNWIIELGARAGKHIDRVFDAARVLRSPGTLNHKSDPPTEVSILSMNGYTHSYNDLDDLLPPLDEFTGELWSQTYDASGVTMQALEDWLDEASQGAHNRGGTERVREATEAVAASRTGGRHDAVFSALASVIQDRERSGKAQINVRLGIGEIAAAFAKAKPDADPSEFGNMVRYLVGQRVREQEKRASSVVTVEGIRVVEGESVPINSGFLDWATLGTEDPEAWVIPGLVSKGLNTFQSQAGVGKSFVAFAIALGLATGKEVLGFAHPTGKPINVSYFDWEMSANDVADRLYSLGFDPDQDDLSHLHYLLYPSFALNDPDGAKEMLDLVRDTDTQVAIFDTMSRAIDAPENDDVGWRDAMKLAWTPLKTYGVTVIRLDHLGKEKRRGGRGSSSKRDEADLIWNINAKTRQGEAVLSFKANKSRVPIPQKEVMVAWRMGDHGVVTFIADPSDPIFTAPSAEVSDLVARLDKAAIPVETSRREARRLLGFRGRDLLLGEALKYRKSGSRNQFGENTPKSGAETVGNQSGTTPTGPAESPEASRQNPGSHSEGTTQEPNGSGATRRGGSPPRGNHAETSASDPIAEGPFGDPEVADADTQVTAIDEGDELLLCPECGAVEMGAYPFDAALLFCAACNQTLHADAYPYKDQK